MSEAFLESYDGQSTDELIALAGKYRIDSLALAFEQATQQKTAAPSKEESYVLAVEALEREINNGGYSQFYANDEPIADRLFEWIGNNRARIQLP